MTDIIAKPEIECDEVFNDKARLATEYDISVDIVTGKIYIAGNLDGSEVILQGILHPYKKDKQSPFVSFDHTQRFGDKHALFSGVVYFENIPCDVLSNGTLINSDTAVRDREPETTLSPSKVELIEDAKIVEEEKPSLNRDVKLEFPDLEKEKFKTIRAPGGLSRTQRSTWWKALRAKYPSHFDVSGNYISWPKAADREQKEWEKETAKISSALVAIQEAADLKENPPLSRIAKPKPEAIVGAGNELTTMADQKIRSGYFIGKYFAEKDAYSVVSAPAESFDKSRILFFNKLRTAEMFLEAAKKSPSFSQKLNGTESVFASTNLKASLFVESNLALYVTNTVTALQGSIYTPKEEAIN